MKILTLILIPLLAGCALMRGPVPATRLNGEIGGIPFTLEAPKQVAAKGIELDLSIATNTFRLRIAELSSVNDPQVIDKAAAGRVAEITAWKELSGELVDRAVKAGGKAVIPVP